MEPRFEDKDQYGDLLFEGNPYIQPLFGKVRPSKVIPHDWQKLREMWKNLNDLYKEADRGFRKSGNHNPNFYDYCGNQTDVFYLHLQIKPHLLDMVHANLPPGASISSEHSVSVKSETSSTRKRKAHMDVALTSSIAQVAKSIDGHGMSKTKYLEEEGTRRDLEIKDNARRSAATIQQTALLESKQLFDQRMETKKLL